MTIGIRCKRTEYSYKFIEESLLSERRQHTGCKKHGPVQSSLVLEGWQIVFCVKSRQLIRPSGSAPYMRFHGTANVQHDGIRLSRQLSVLNTLAKHRHVAGRGLQYSGNKGLVSRIDSSPMRWSVFSFNRYTMMLTSFQVKLRQIRRNNELDVRHLC